MVLQRSAPGASEPAAAQPNAHGQVARRAWRRVAAMKPRSAPCRQRCRQQQTNRNAARIRATSSQATRNASPALVEPSKLGWLLVANGASSALRKVWVSLSGMKKAGMAGLFLCNPELRVSLEPAHFRPRNSSSGSTLGSLPRKARYIEASSSLLPRESTSLRKVSPFSRVRPPCSLNHSKAS